MTGRRVPTEPYDPVAVRAWTWITCSLFVVAVVCVWLVAGWLLADWGLSGRVVAAGVGGFVSGIGCWLASHARDDALAGPPDEVYDAVERRAWEWGGGPS